MRRYELMSFKERLFKRCEWSSLCFELFFPMLGRFFTLDLCSKCPFPLLFHIWYPFARREKHCHEKKATTTSTLFRQTRYWRKLSGGQGTSCLSIVASHAEEGFLFAPPSGLSSLNNILPMVLSDRTCNMSLWICSSSVGELLGMDMGYKPHSEPELQL